MIRHIATLIDGLARTIRIHEDEYDKLLRDRDRWKNSYQSLLDSMGKVENRWQGCLDVANRNAAEARGEADRLRAQLFETREQRDEAREREITFKTQAHFAAQQRDNALRPTNPIIAEVEALLRERLKDYVRK